MAPMPLKPAVTCFAFAILFVSQHARESAAQQRNGFRGFDEEALACPANADPKDEPQAAASGSAVTDSRTFDYSRIKQRRQQISSQHSRMQPNSRRSHRPAPPDNGLPDNVLPDNGLPDNGLLGPGHLTGQQKKLLTRAAALAASQEVPEEIDSETLHYQSVPDEPEVAPETPAMASPVLSTAMAPFGQTVMPMTTAAATYDSQIEQHVTISQSPCAVRRAMVAAGHA
jgi:hypothetical protein